MNTYSYYVLITHKPYLDPYAKLVTQKVKKKSLIAKLDDSRGKDYEQYRFSYSNMHHC